MQKCLGRPMSLPLSGERGRKAEVPNDLGASSGGGRGDRNGKCHEDQGPQRPRALQKGPRARRLPPPGAGTRLWGTVRWAGKMGTRLGSGTPQRCLGLPSLHLLPSPSSPGSPGNPGDGAGAPSCRRPWCGGKEGPPGVAGGRRAWSHNFLRPEAGRAGAGSSAAPGGSARPGTPGGPGRREETRAGED